MRRIPVPTDFTWSARHGAIGGMVGGIVFAVYTMVFAALVDGMDALFVPLRLIGAMVIGPVALDGDYPLLVAGGAGILVHGVLAMLFGVTFAALAGRVPALRESPMSLPTSATVYGFILWVVNFQMIAPAAGWAWLPAGSLPTAQLLAHAFGFGTVLGLYLDRTLIRPRLRQDPSHREGACAAPSPRGVTIGVVTHVRC